MEVNTSIITAAPLAVLAWTVAFVPVKPWSRSLSVPSCGGPYPVGARVAVILAHGGKDGLMLLTLAMKAGTIAAEAGQSALLALIATMAIGPILIQQNAKIEVLLSCGFSQEDAAAVVTTVRAELNPEVIGRVGI